MIFEVDENRAQAKALGWKPRDFGSDGYDRKLVDAIYCFQADHLLPETGIADARTYRALLSFRKGISDGAFGRATQPHKDALGAVYYYPPDDPRVIRSAPFVGVSEWVDTIEGLSSALDAGVETVVLPPDLIGYDVPDSVRTIASWVLDPSAPWRDGAAAADLVRSSPWVKGFVLELLPEAYRENVQTRGKTIADFVDAFEARTDLPKALHAQIGPTRGTTIEDRRSLGSFERFDVLLPEVPGRFQRANPERQVGKTLIACSIFARVRPSFAFPVIVPADYTSRNDVIRFRAWNRARGIRGIGIRGATEDLRRAFFGPLPPDEEIERVDRF